MEKWYIPLTGDNYDEVKSWWLKQVKKSGWCSTRLPHDAFVLSKHAHDCSYYFSSCEESLLAQHPSYQKITLEQFRQITNSKPMPKTIRISRDLLNDYYEASTTEQKDYLVEHFKLDGTTTDEAIRGLHDIACSTWKSRIKKNHPDCFPEESKHFDFSGVERKIVSDEIADELGMRHGFIQVRNHRSNPETHGRSFYLTTEYNWELKQDGREDEGPVYVLIPTKK